MVVVEENVEQWDVILGSDSTLKVKGTLSNAPVTRAFIVASALSTIFFGIQGRFNTLGLSYQDIFGKLRIWKLIMSVFSFSSTPELMFGLYLLYYFRVFERQIGSNKYSVFIVFSILSSLLFEVLAVALLKASFVIMEKIHLTRDVWHPCWFLIPFECLLHPKSKAFYPAMMLAARHSWYHPQGFLLSREKLLCTRSTLSLCFRFWIERAVIQIYEGKRSGVDGFEQWSDGKTLMAVGEGVSGMDVLVAGETEGSDISLAGEGKVGVALEGGDGKLAGIAELRDHGSTPIWGETWILTLGRKSE
ncbi:putative ubiquitin-associated domain-containing protein 2 [Sesbania bispinosa]|nr:putative ubiquitin-associated domain-containing protein 2 [Sesbania bispinosa]